MPRYLIAWTHGESVKSHASASPLANNRAAGTGTVLSETVATVSSQRSHLVPWAIRGCTMLVFIAENLHIPGQFGYTRDSVLSTRIGLLHTTAPQCHVSYQQILWYVPLSDNYKDHYDNDDWCTPIWKINCTVLSKLSVSTDLLVSCSCVSARSTSVDYIFILKQHRQTAASINFYLSIDILLHLRNCER